MEPHREEPQKAPPGAGQKPKRFRIVKLEERIAPSRSWTDHRYSQPCNTNGGCNSYWCNSNYFCTIHKC